MDLLYTGVVKFLVLTFNTFFNSQLFVKVNLNENTRGSLQLFDQQQYLFKAIEHVTLGRVTIKDGHSSTKD